MEQSTNAKKYISKYNSIKTNMHKKMQNVKPAESISVLFIKQMLPHHEGAIKMCENILAYTSDYEVEQLSKTIKKQQAKHITQMKNLQLNCASFKNAKKDIMQYNKNLTQIMKEMMTEMDNALEEQNLNSDFLSEMIPHHEGAIKMCENVLQFEISPNLKKMVQQTIQNQTTQEKQMQSMLKKQK